MRNKQTNTNMILSLIFNILFKITHSSTLPNQEEEELDSLKETSKYSMQRELRQI